MQAPLFKDVRRKHQQVLQAVARLESALPGSASARDGDRAVFAALGTFLGFCARTLEPLMRDEERRVYPLLDRCLPREVGSSAAMLQEHETIRGLISLLRTSCARMRQGVPDAAPDVSALAQDLTLVLRHHVRKEDGVIHPLLERLLAGSRGLTRGETLSRRARRGRPGSGPPDR